MRRVITGLLALALALVTAAMRNADVLAGSCRSVSLRYRQPLSAGQVEAAEKSSPALLSGARRPPNWMAAGAGRRPPFCFSRVTPPSF